MGFWTPDTTVSVSSVAYNLAGDEAERTNYLKSIVIGETLSSGDSDLGGAIVSSMLNGPGISQRNAVRWTNTNYPIGQTTATIRNTYQVDPDIIAGEITPPAGQETVVRSAFVEDANFVYFAQKHIYENHPSLIDTNWTSDYDPILNEVIIQYEDTTTESIPATGYDKEAVYLVVYYEFVTPYEEETAIEGTLVPDVVDEASLPDTTGYALDMDWTVVTTILLNLTETTEILMEYSDATPDDYSTSDDVVATSYDVEQQIWIKEIYAGTDDVDERVITERDIRNFFRLSKVETTVNVDVVVEDIGGGVDRTTTTTVTTEALIDTWSYRDDTQTIYYGAVDGGTRMLLYKMGGANSVFNALSENASSAPSEFYPFIPIRINNTPIDDAMYAGDFYDESKKAYKRITNEDYQEVLDSIEENPDVGDIDYAYMVFGVSLNVKSNSSKKYIYDFLKSLISYQLTSTAAYETFLNDRDAYEVAITTYNVWFAAQSNPADPLYGTPRPPKPALLTPQYTTLRLNSSDVRVESYDLRLSWITIQEEVFSGEGRPGAMPGDVWLEAGIPDDVEIILSSNSQPVSIETLYVYRQQDEVTYTKLTCKGLYHENFVYDGNKVTINSSQALLEVEESGFIIPMHNPTMRAMALVDSNQVSIENMFIVFNAYTVVTQSWFETGIFQVIIAVTIAVATVFFAPAGAITGGILGTNVAVGSFIGLTGTSALLAGAAANAIAGMIVASLITEVSVKLFGEKWGAVFGVIFGYVAMQGLTSLSTSGQLGMNWGEMMKIDNIMNLTKVGADAYSAWVRGDILEIQAEMVQNEEDYNQEQKLIDEQMQALGINTGLVIDPMWFTSVLETQYSTQESPQAFINRTTMVASDMIDMSLSMIYDYVEINQTLPSIGT